MRIALLCVAMGALLALPASPQSAELGISGGYGIIGDSTIAFSEIFNAPGAGSPATGPRDEYNLSSGIRVGARMALNTRAFLGHELSYAFQNTSLGFLADGASGGEADLGRVAVHNMYYNFVLHGTPTRTPIRPFVTGGGGFSSFFLPNVSSFSGRGNTKFGYNYGGGVKFNFFKYGIRLDVRNHVTGKPFDQFLPNVEGNLNNIEVSMTFSLLLG